MTESLARLPMDHFVVWTGQSHRGLQTSRIADCVAAMRAEKPWTPVSLRQMFQRILSSGGMMTTDELKTALRLHQGASPAVLILVRKAGRDEFRSVHDIPMGLGLGSAVKSGDVIRFDIGA